MKSTTSGKLRVSSNSFVQFRRLPLKATVRSFALLFIVAVLLSSSCNQAGTKPDDTENVTLFATQECSVRDQDPGTNHDALELMVQNYTNTNARSYVLFDLSSIPASASIEEARLELYYCQCDGIDSIAVYPAEENWSAATVTWDDQPGPSALGQPLDVVHLGPDFMGSGDCGDVDEYVPQPGGSASKTGWYITTLVQEWVDGTRVNHGVVFMAHPEQPVPDPPGRIGAIFGNIENSGFCPENPPRLLVEYN